MTDIWDYEPAPWATFKDALTIDRLERQTAGVLAVNAWPGVSTDLLIAASMELERIKQEGDVFDRDIDARRAAWLRDHPGSEWERREP